ncbi:MAG: hypothetical protein OXP69_06715, partial [Spirochaetaceae bacterium]|nr:hypothetical protein [Spirochaetaceae bacterium]
SAPAAKPTWSPPASATAAPPPADEAAVILFERSTIYRAGEGVRGRSCRRSATVRPKPVSLSYAPMLAELVAADELPPVDERLPEDPKVKAVVEEIG